MSDGIPTFGEKEEGRHYTDRPGAYALIVCGGELLIVDENSGWFLPGGGLEAGESAVEALHREVLEETGYRIEEPTPMSRVCQYLISQSEQTAYAKDCHIFQARLADRPHPGHCELLWIPPEEAVAKLAHECFRWVVEKYVIGRSGA